MSKDIPTGAVGLKKGAKVSAVRPVQDYLKQFGYLESEGSPFVPDGMYMRRTSNDYASSTLRPRRHPASSTTPPSRPSSTSRNSPGWRSPAPSTRPPARR